MRLIILLAILLPSVALPCTAPICGQGFGLRYPTGPELPANAPLIFGSTCISLDLSVTVDGAPAALEAVDYLPDRMLDPHAASNDLTRNELWRGVRVVPQPPIGAEVRVTGRVCADNPDAADFEGIGECEFDQTLTVIEPDLIAPLAIRGATLDLFEHEDWSTCECGREAAGQGDRRWYADLDRPERPEGQVPEFLKAELLDGEEVVLTRWFDERRWARPRLTIWAQTRRWEADPRELRLRLTQIDAAGNAAPSITTQRPCRIGREVIPEPEDGADAGFPPERSCNEPPPEPDWAEFPARPAASCPADIAPEPDPDMGVDVGVDIDASVDQGLPVAPDEGVDQAADAGHPEIYPDLGPIEERPDRGPVPDRDPNAPPDPPGPDLQHDAATPDPNSGPLLDRPAREEGCATAPTPFALWLLLLALPRRRQPTA